ncbi:MAG: GAF domain-containing protein [Flavobacteriales bacterium]|nr:GAF domain-containing protein [Flavobacteriales bacterium]
MDVHQLFRENFPFKTELNFDRIFEFWEDQANSSNRVVAENAKSILETVQSEPELKGVIEDRSIIKKHFDKVELLLSDIFSKATWKNEMKGVLAAFDSDCFYETPSFHDVINIFRSENGGITEEEYAETIYFQIIGAYVEILENFYDFPVERRPYRVISLIDPKTGLERSFYGQMSMEFVDLVLEDELPELSEEELIELINNYKNLDLWLEKLPPRIFKFSGVSIIDLVDVTEQEILSRLKADLLKPGALSSPESILSIEKCFQSLMGRKDAKIGIAFYQRLRDEIIFMGTKLDASDQEKADDFKCGMNDLDIKAIMGPFFESKEPIVLTNVHTAEINEMMRSTLLEFNIKSMILIPLVLNNHVVGLFEIVSEEVNAFSSLDLLRFNDLIPLLAISVERVRNEEETEVTRIIKDKFTSLHSAVEWKFQEVALDYLDAEKKNEEKSLGEVVFENVHPLYGSSDVRNSSTIRNGCIQIDLVSQLDMVSDVLKHVIKKHPFPIYKELEFEVQNFRVRVSDRLLSDEEVQVVEFIRTEIEPLFKHLYDDNKDLQEHIDKYFDALDDNHGIIYHKRKAFEDSIEMINHMSYSLIEKEEEKTQQMFPYYFENYKTDGVEYNIYIGQSIAKKKKKYNPIYLQNLRLWQLMLMCKVTRETNKILPELPIALQTAQLILVQSAPLSIRFRTDEKKFDVDGAYNIRYEIMKKRIDKATIAGTGERLTQPHTVSVIFSQAREEAEYMSYIKYLTHLNFIEANIERFDLEQMQGVSGLKAIRITVNLSENNTIEKAFEKEMQEVVGVVTEEV